MKNHKKTLTALIGCSTRIVVRFAFMFAILLAIGKQSAAQVPARGVNVTGATPAAQTSAPATPALGEPDRTVLEASNYLSGRIPRGSKVAFVSVRQNFPVLSEYIINGLIANAVNGNTFSVVDRAQLDAIRLEQEFQTSGAVSDSTVRSIGRMLGAQSIITVMITQAGNMYVLGIRALDIESAQIQGQFNRNILGGATVNALATAHAPQQTVTMPSTTTRPVAAATAPAQLTAQTQTGASAIQGIAVPGANLTEKLAWLQKSADSHNTYIIELNADERIAPHTFHYQGAINITIVLRGDRQNRTLRLSTHGIMFRIRENVTFILDNNITLHGHNGNNESLVRVDGGTLIMNAGATITGNAKTTGGGGGVDIPKGTFTMNGGTISGNTASTFGGGVCICGGTFTMNGGTISGNRATYGGGVDVHIGIFNMSGGTIIGNSVAVHGGGVGVARSSTFNMRGGTIISNSAQEYGGGVAMFGIFTKTGGTVTGYNSDRNNGNAVRDEDGSILARRGHAVWVSSNVRKETTAGTGINLSYGGSRGTTGAWDQ